jgi:hypothetical protein
MNRLEPKNKNPDPSMWLDEAIWGHRLYDEQTPWFIYLEFMNVYCYARSQGTIFQETDYNTLSYVPAQRLYLRNILFNYPLTKMEQICKKTSGEAQQWDSWIKEMEETQQGLVNPDFSYLKNHFETFTEFVEVIKVLHSTSLEMTSNKRWTSKFVFPYCPEALYEDLDKKARTNDRRFFGRTGELLYLIFCRAGNNSELSDLIEKRLFQHNTVWDTVIQCLQPGNEALPKEKEGGFLPYESHHLFDELASDWISILQLDIPPYDLIPHLVRMTGFHMMRYQQQISRELLGENRTSYFVAEVVAPKKTMVRELSVESYQENNVLSTKAIDRYITDIESSDDWQNALQDSDPYNSCYEILTRTVLWPRKEQDYDGVPDPSDLLSAFRDKARTRHSQHISNIHRVYGREIGLVSKRGTNRLRYAPTDAFIKTLVLSTVSKRMELEQFLQKLSEKYGLILGSVEAERYSKLVSCDFDKKAFQGNSERLEQRLSSIGLLKRLSDGCAYVINPFSILEQPTEDLS